MSHSYDWIRNVFCFIFWSIECLLLLVVIILCIPVECVTGNITCELPIFWILCSSKHGIEEDFESSADGVPKAFSLGQHHRAGVKILYFTFSTLFPIEFLVDDLGGVFLLPSEMLIPWLCNDHHCTCLCGWTLWIIRVLDSSVFHKDFSHCAYPVTAT